MKVRKGRGLRWSGGERFEDFKRVEQERVDHVIAMAVDPRQDTVRAKGVCDGVGQPDEGSGGAP